MAQEVENHLMRAECRKAFEQITERLDKGDHSFKEHSDAIHRTDIELAELRTNMNNLVKSMDQLTKGIWGMVLAIAGTGIGFVIWFIQSSRG